MSTVSIRDSGIPRLYRTEWLRSEIGPDSGTLASRLARGLRGLRGLGNIIPPFEVYKAEVNEALSRWHRQEITDDDAYAIEEASWTRYVATIEEESQRIEDDAYDFYLEMERIAFEKHQLPGTDRVKPEEYDAYKTETDAAYAVYEEAVATAQMMRDEATEHGRKDRIAIVTGQTPRWIWPAVVAIGVIGGGIWALARGRRARA